MREHGLMSILQRIYGSDRTDMGNWTALEADLLSRYRKLHPTNRKWLVLLNPWSRTARFGFAGLAVCLLVVGACTTETTTEVEVGKQLIVNVDGDADPRFLHTFIHIDQENPRQPQDEITELLKAQPGVEDASVSVSGEEEGKRVVSVHILVFGSNLDGEVLVNTLTDSYPPLSREAVTINDLRTTFSESLASRIGHTLFRVKRDRPDPRELRLRALEELGDPR